MVIFIFLSKFIFLFALYFLLLFLHWIKFVTLSTCYPGFLYFTFKFRCYNPQRMESVARVLRRTPRPERVQKPARVWSLAMAGFTQYIYIYIYIYTYMYMYIKINQKSMISIVYDDEKVPLSTSNIDFWTACHLSVMSNRPALHSACWTSRAHLSHIFLVTATTTSLSCPEQCAFPESYLPDSYMSWT